MENILSVISAIVGTALVAVALAHLVPQGMWLYLGALVAGTQCITMAIRSTTR